MYYLKLYVLSMLIYFVVSVEDVYSRLSNLEKRLEAEENHRKTLERKIDAYQDTIFTCDQDNKILQEKLASQQRELKMIKNYIWLNDDHRLNNSLLTSVKAKRQDIPEAVAFTAYIDHDIQHIGIEQVIPYNQVVSNIGGSFDTSTHVFTCPVTGIYLFSYVVSQLGMTEIDIKLVVDGKNIVDAISDPVTAGHDQQAVNIGVVQVNKGQHVYVVNYYHTDVSLRSDELYRFSSFSGVLIQPL